MFNPASARVLADIEPGLGQNTSDRSYLQLGENTIEVIIQGSEALVCFYQKTFGGL